MDFDKLKELLMELENRPYRHITITLQENVKGKWDISVNGGYLCNGNVVSKIVARMAKKIASKKINIPVNQVALFLKEHFKLKTFYALKHLDLSPLHEIKAKNEHDALEQAQQITTEEWESQLETDGCMEGMEDAPISIMDEKFKELINTKNKEGNKLWQNQS